MVNDMNVGSDSWRIAKALPFISSIFFGLLLSLLFIGTAKVAIHSAPSFDGGMNLEVQLHCQRRRLSSLLRAARRFPP